MVLVALGKDRSMSVPRRAVLAGLASFAALAPAASLRAQPFTLGHAFDPGAALGPAPLMPTWRRNAVTVDMTERRPKIALVIDDLGVMRAHSAQAVTLPGPLTLAWFPFAADLAEQVAEAAAHGHEAMLHMPMQAYSNSTVQTGPDPLRVDLPPEINRARLRNALAAVPNIVGLNNHMGSVATRDLALMDLMARETRAHEMLFLDSVVIPHSMGLRAAEAEGVPAAARDVFIDNDKNPALIRAQLAATEAFARRYGYAIAIGHPRPNTLAALEEWLPTLAGKGFALWPISAAVRLRNGIDVTLSV
jgi:polysaccharide deacetylase 2 family uncharacterized protein YibQ